MVVWREIDAVEAVVGVRVGVVRDGERWEGGAERLVAEAAA